MKTPVRLSLVLAGISLIGGVLEVRPVAAQGTVNKKALEHTTFYNAPREIQILDENPLIRDFRTAPAAAGSVMLPPGPGAAPAAGPPSASGGSGAGALGGRQSDNGDLPAGGLRIPGNGPGYRTSSPLLPALNALPQSGFGSSNIPSRGMGPKGLLPPGVTTGVHANVAAKSKPTGLSGTPTAGVPKGIAPSSGRTHGNSAPVVASYSGGSGTGSGNAYGGSANRSESNVRGFLMRKNK